MKKFLIISALSLPAWCLLWRWKTLPTMVPVHLSRNGADQYADKHQLILDVLLPLLIFGIMSVYYSASAGKTSLQNIRTGVLIFASLVICAWVLTISPVP